LVSCQIHLPLWQLRNKQKRKYAANCINCFYICIFPSDASAPFARVLSKCLKTSSIFDTAVSMYVQIFHSSLQSYQFASLSQYCENALSERLCLKFPVRRYQREFREDVSIIINKVSITMRINKLSVFPDFFATTSTDPHDML